MFVVLLVEDDQMSRDMLVRRLTRLDYVVITAANGREAVETALTVSPNIILMDMCMPEMDGMEATKRLKAHRKTGHIPIIALTALNTTQDVRRAIQAGCDGFETKPVNLTRLNQKIHKLVVESRQAMIQQDPL
ncbi:MAG: response regulator [Bryobacteraceae bacterium]|jgi:CheY-like chemotaxis protein